jgi:cytochrome c oxidase assembly factor CtaG
MGVGVAASALGGILSSLGLEEAGEAFATFGNYAILAGTALMGVAQILKYIPVLLNAIMAHPIAAVVIAVLSVILAGVLAIINVIKNNSPEAKLKKAQEAA